MMQNDDFFYLGMITKPFGYKGELYIYLDTDQPEKYCPIDSLFIEEEDEILPYMVDSMEYRGDNLAVVKFRDLDGEDAKKLLKTRVFLPMSLLPPLTGNSFYYHEVIGFDVIDKEKGNIGKIVDFVEASIQPIMQIDCDGVEILIPAIDQIFDLVDRDNRQILITAPEGLIEVYLKN
jgi:16S rRNA processing protein RimM